MPLSVLEMVPSRSKIMVLYFICGYSFAKRRLRRNCRHTVGNFRVLQSIIVGFYLEISFRVVAGGTLLRREFSYVYMTAVAAHPHGIFSLVEHLAGLYVVRQRAVSFLVGLFDCRNQTEFRRYVLEALFSATSANSLYISVHSAFSPAAASRRLS